MIPQPPGIRSALLAGQADTWASGRVGGRDSLLVPYAGPPLAPGRAYFWRVRVEGSLPDSWRCVPITTSSRPPNSNVTDR